MNVYIAGKVGESEPQLRKLKIDLAMMGFEVPYDWSESRVQRPYGDYPEEAGEAGERMIEAVMKCDVLIVLYDRKGLGLHIETGAMIVGCAVQKLFAHGTRKHIYIVGAGPDESVFHFLPGVNRVLDYGSLIRELAKIKGLVQA